MIVVRSATADDAADVAAIYGPFVRDTWVSFEEDVPDAREMLRRIDAARGRYPWLVAESDGRMAGFAYAGEHRARAGYRFSVDVSVYLGDGFRRAGIATRLYEDMFARLVAQNFTMVYAGIALPNDASVAFHGRMGFAPVGTYRNVGYKAGGWHDVLWLQRELAPPASPPREPLPARRDA